MHSRASIVTPETKLFHRAWVVYVLALALFYVLLTAGLAPEDRQTASQVGLFLGGIVAASATGYRARLSIGRRRRAWALMSVGVAFGVLGNVWGALISLGIAPASSVVLADLTFLFALGSGIAALLSFPTTRRRGAEAARMVIDGVVVGGSVLYMASLFVFADLFEGSGETAARQVLAVIIPLFDVLLVTLAILLIPRVGRADRPALGLFVGGMVLYAMADLVFASQSARGVFTVGTLLDLVWIAGYGLISLAALRPAPPQPPAVDEHVESSPVAVTVLMFGLFFAAAIVAFVAAADSGSAAALGFPVWIVVLLAVATRQILLIVDNENLRQGLERRVRERTSDLSKLTKQRELLLRSVADGIYGVDRSGRVTFVNPAVEHTLGYSAEELVGTLAHDTFHGPGPDDRPLPIEKCYVTAAIQNGTRTVGEADVYRGPDGRAVPVEVTASPITSEEGIQGAVVAFRDVTERLEVDRLKDEFVSIVSHELRTPLTAIRGSLGLLAGGVFGTLAPEASRMITIAVESSDRLGRLINDILDIERIDAGTTLDVDDVPVSDLVDDALAQMSVVAADAGVELTRVGAEGMVRADPDRVLQTLLNLLGNALKFAPRGTAVEVEAVEDGEMIEFRVSDKGRGVPPDRLETIFTRFEQVDSSDARELGGTGLGLAICRSIVERHGGRIWVESVPGSGSDFRFTLPRAPQGAQVQVGSSRLG